jgi:hemerythrin-like domain-containing protein
MKRHPALVPLSHDHHHALVEARRLQRAAHGPESAAAAAAFLRFFAQETVRHFREEEELLFPSVVDFQEAHEPLVQALLEHQRLHSLATRLQQLVPVDGAASDIMRELGQLLEAHIRHEERRLFPLIERLLSDATLTRLPTAGREKVEAREHDQSAGTTLGMASDDLNGRGAEASSRSAASESLPR